MPKYHDQSRAESIRRELHAAYQRWRHNVSGNPNNKEVAQSLVEDDFCRHPRISATENDGKRLQACRHFVASCLIGKRIAASNLRHEAIVSPS
jgi:hypothetical protein